jgi:hypothetical protein
LTVAITPGPALDVEQPIPNSNKDAVKKDPATVTTASLVLPLGFNFPLPPVIPQE